MNWRHIFVLLGKQYRLWGLLLLGWAVSLGLFVWNPAMVTSLASSVSDRYYSFNRYAPDKNVVFVVVDHAAVGKLGRWPWSRDVLAGLIAKLDKASVLTLDMQFSEPTGEAEDRVLGATLGLMPTVGGFFLNGVIDSQPGPEAMDLLANSALLDTAGFPLSESHKIELSIAPVLSGMAAVAAMNTQADADERFRHYPAALIYQKFVLPSLGLQSLRLFLNAESALKSQGGFRLEIGSHRVALNRLGYTRLNLYPEDKFQRISFAEIAAPDFDPKRVEGKIVLVGLTEAGVTDIRATPLGQYPGALLHATFISNVLGQHTLAEVNPVPMAGLLFVVTLICFGLSFLSRILVRLPCYVFLLVASYALGVFCYRDWNIWLESAYPMWVVVLSALIIESSLLGMAKEHSRMLRGAFASYLLPALVDRIVEQPEKLKLGGEKKLITVLFSDIRGFTSLSESMSPELLASTMLGYFQPMTEAIFAQGGTLDKYIGDAIMALFNAPLDQANHAEAACRAAVAMQYAQVRINEGLKQQGGAPLRTGIGINTGYAVVGNLGSQIRFNYTAIGDSVNLASRLESSTKTLGVDIVIGESTYALVKDVMPCRYLGEIQVAGKEKLQQVYALDWQKIPDPFSSKA